MAGYHPSLQRQWAFQPPVVRGEWNRIEKLLLLAFQNSKAGNWIDSEKTVCFVNNAIHDNQTCANNICWNPSGKKNFIQRRQDHDPYRVSAENKSFPAIRFCSFPRWTPGFSGHPDRFLLVDINAQHHPVELLPCKAANIRSIPWPAIVSLCSQPLVDQGDTVRLFHDCFDPVTSAAAEQKEHGGYSWRTAPVCLHIIHRLTCTYWSCRR